MIRILQLTSLKCGGAESVLMNYYRKMDSSDICFDFFVFSNKEEFFENEIISRNGTIIKADPDDRLRSGMKLLKELGNSNKYDVIEIHTENAHSVIWVIISYLSGFKKVIVHSHSTNNSKKVEHFLCKVLLNLLPIKKFSCGKEASKYMFFRDNAYLVNNAIDLRKYAYNGTVRKKMRSELGINDELILGHVGRFIELKNHKLLLNICKCFITDGVEFKLLLIGDGELFQSIKKMAKKLDIENSVIFTGNVNNVSDYLQAMDLFVLPSYYEGFPTVAVEAQSAGLKCLLSDTITHDVNVTGLVEFYSIKESPKDWKKKIHAMLPYERIDTSSKLQNRGFDIVTETNKLAKVYHEIAGNIYEC